MRCCNCKTGKIRLSFKFRFITRAVIAAVVSVLAAMFLLWPGVQTWAVVRDKSLATEGMARQVPGWFADLSPRFEKWADKYLATGYGFNAHHEDVAATEWPLFGVVFYLCAAADLHREGKIDATQKPFAGAIRKASDIVVSPAAGAWTKEKWGDNYLTEQNVFYRMLVIMGLAAYEELTGDTAHREMMSEQRRNLCAEFLAAPDNILDDYPGECWPSDLIWAAAAIKRAAALEGEDDGGLGVSMAQIFDGPFAMNGLPVYKIDNFGSKWMETFDPRGCGNSYALIFARDLDADTAARWFARYEADFWRRNAWVCGFHETPWDGGWRVQDVDSGPVLAGFGSMASAFGIGAARSFGRYDMVRPLVLEVVAAAWPTPFGFMLPRILGRVAVDGGPLGEAALLFSMTRPCRVETTTAADNYVPRSVSIGIAFYLLSGFAVIFIEIRTLRKWWKKHRKSAAPGVDFSDGRTRTKKIAANCPAYAPGISQ